MRAVVASAVALAIAGCTPPVPFALLESAETLPRRAFSVALAGGGGGAGGTSTAKAGGGMVRARVGVGADQEVGLDAGAYMTGVPGSGSVYGTGALRWKLALSRRFAVVAGAGLSFIEKSVDYGGDFGAVYSTRPFDGPMRLYFGARATLMLPAERDVLDGGGVTGGASLVPFGIDYEPAPGWHCAIEVGLLGGGSAHHDVFNNVPGPIYERWLGAYGAIALSRAWTRR